MSKNMNELTLKDKLQLCKRILSKDDSGLMKHAIHELGFLNSDGDEMQMMMNKDILELIHVFSTQGHSGSSAQYAINLFRKLANYELLWPITGEDDEWNLVTDTLYQNKRCSHVFKENGRAYDIDGKIFTDTDGCSFTNINSHVYITFPYIPNREYIKLNWFNKLYYMIKGKLWFLKNAIK